MFGKTKKIAFFVFFLLLISPLFSRDIEITVVDQDLDIPLEGAVIRNYDGREYTCDSYGKVRLSVPEQRQVIIQAAYPGYENGRLVILTEGNSFLLKLRLLGVMESRELVIEAPRPGTSETRTGRSVAVSEKEISQTSEIGVIEDVMTTIKLLPGVGYTGLFDAQPSIRGGEPGDMYAALDGYYITNPYHWGGGFSIFDPRMIQSAQLSHGVFSTRYGHSISGLLDLAAKKPSSTETEFELAINTSAANFNLSLPLFNKGGIMFMGRVTYYDPVIWLAKQMSKAIEILEVVNSIRVAPYIRSGAITANYRFYDNLDLQATGFWGMDGVGATFNNGPATSSDGLTTKTDIVFDWTNYQGFLTAALSWNPRSDMLLKFSGGTGYEDAVVEGDMKNVIIGKSITSKGAGSWYDTFTNNLLYSSLLGSKIQEPYDFNTTALIEESDFLFNAQSRIDYDWEPGRGFLVAAGIQEMFTRYSSKGIQKVLAEKALGNFKSDEPDEQREILIELGIDPDDPANAGIITYLKRYLMVNFQVEYPPNAYNRLFSTSGYVLSEFNTANKRFGAELGLRVDHYYLLGDGFSLISKPIPNPRLNLDFNILNRQGFIQKLDLSAGTGLFSSISTNVLIAEEKYNIEDFKPNRSWTSVIGGRIEFWEGLSLNIEGYYKYIFDRLYIPISLGLDDVDVQPHFNGEGRVWGIDLQLQKMQARYWDGWLSYSFNWSKYRNPDGGNSDMGISGGTQGKDWYFPSYHRFHNLNLVLNIKPSPRFNIYTRFGFASGVQISRRIGNAPISYPVYDREQGIFIEKFYWPSERDEKHRTTPSFPLDVKFSILGSSSSGKARYEVYVAVENILALVYSAQGNTSFNSYTGEEDTGSMSASYEIPIPIPSFGFKISY